MEVNDMLKETGGVASMARELGISEDDAASGAQALLPAVLGGFKKQALLQSGGAEGLEGLLAQLGGGSLLDEVLSPQPTHVGRGNDVLGEIFGSKDVSRAVATGAASRSGLSPELLKKMLPIVAMLAAGYLARRSASHAPTSRIGGMLSGMLGGQSASAMSLASMIDLDGDGNPLDDILKLAGKALR